MRVSPSDRFQIIYSVFEHQYLGHLFESFVIKLDEKDRLTYQHQNISHKNAKEFNKGLDHVDFELIELMDNIQQDVIVKKFFNKKISPADFFLKVYDKEKGDKLLQETIQQYIEGKKTKILNLLYENPHKMVFIMGNDGEPAWKQVQVEPEKAKVLFHFFKNEDNTHYFPTVKHKDKKVEFQYNDSEVICNYPAWLLTKDQLLTFEKEVDGKKLKPFLKKKFIVIPQNIEEKYYNNFVTNLVANFDVHAQGFDIKTEQYNAVPLLTFSELAEGSSMQLFSNGNGKNEDDADGKLVFDLAFRYGDYKFSVDTQKKVSVKLEKNKNSYIFHRVRRDIDTETKVIKFLKEKGMEVRHGKAVMPKAKAFQWLHDYEEELKKSGFIFSQSQKDKKKFFLGTYSINIEVKETNDWFDIYATVKFGDFEIPFVKLRKMILKKQREFELPNGEIAVIPEEWVTQYAELFAFSEEDEDEAVKLKKHHLALVQELQEDSQAKVSIDRKLEKLKHFESIEDYPLPKSFNGDLRPYQKAGYNWLRFLNDYKFGGCLADDMGLGKTVQTLAMLLDQKEKGASNASLLVMPTSLLYNWEMEASKFTPDLKIFTYSGTNRDKNIEQFEDYDVIITSYGIVRLDIDILKEYYFNYIILDESQAIKNPTSNISMAVRELKSKSKVILSGTPIENSTMDLWSQMSFVNPGLLGSQSFFKKEFLNPIEKKQDEGKIKKLYSIIKPFILRREKSQVVTELPEKIEQVRYISMSPEQEKEYEETKSYYRNRILEEIEEPRGKNSQFTLLQGLTKLRLIANHPKLVDETYKKGSGKLDDVLEMLNDAIQNDHKVLIFSQFVKHLAIIKDHLDSKKMDYAYLDGSTKARKSQVELFQTNDHVKIFLISLKAGGLGLNLTAADYVFILDPWWNPAIEAQAVDRAHRIGQKNTVFNYKFITKNSVEEKILRLQHAKKKLASDLITTEESFIKSLSNEDIISLLE